MELKAKVLRFRIQGLRFRVDRGKPGRSLGAPKESLSEPRGPWFPHMKILWGCETLGPWAVRSSGLGITG